MSVTHSVTGKAYANENERPVANRMDRRFVVVFNLTRFARDKYDHFALRSHLLQSGLHAGTGPV